MSAAGLPPHRHGARADVNRVTRPGPSDRLPGPTGDTPTGSPASAPPQRSGAVSVACNGVTRSPTDEFLKAVTAPLEFLAAASPEAAARTRLPSRQLAAQAESLARSVAGPGQRQALEALAAELSGFDGVAPAQRR